MGDFGRVNAHQKRWSQFPGLREPDTHKRPCPFCWARSPKLHEDAEWHSVFSCPVGHACPERCQRALSNAQLPLNCSENPPEILKNPSNCSRLPHSSDLALLIILCRTDGHVAGELARFVVDLTASRCVR